MCSMNVLCVDLCVCVCTCARVGDRRQQGSWCHSPPHPLQQRLSLNLNYAGGRQASVTLSLPPQHWVTGTQGHAAGCQNLNPGPQCFCSKYSYLMKHLPNPKMSCFKVNYNRERNIKCKHRKENKGRMGSFA